MTGKSSPARKTIGVKIDPDGLIAKLLSKYQERESVPDTSIALRELLLFALLRWHDGEPDDDPALYDIYYHRWTSTLAADAVENQDDFIRWIAAQEMPKHGGKRPGAGKPRKERRNSNENN